MSYLSDLVTISVPDHVTSQTQIKLPFLDKKMPRIDMLGSIVKLATTYSIS